MGRLQPEAEPATLGPGGRGMIRSVAEFLDEAKGYAPRQVERDLIAACRDGKPLDLGDLPAEGDTTREIRADLLRLIITGGTPECGLHPVGIMLSGAFISGTLDLQFAKGRGLVALHKCRFTERPNLAQAEIAQLSLQGSLLPGLFAQGIRVEGGLFLRGVTATGTVDVNGARIIGQIDCDGATLDGGKDKGGRQQKALNAQGAEIGGNLFVRGLSATGTFDVSGARISGQMECDGAILDGGMDRDGNRHRSLRAQGTEIAGSLFLRGASTRGMIDLNRARIAGQLNFDGAKLDGGEDRRGHQRRALLAQRMSVASGFIFYGIKSVLGQVHLGSAHVGDLEDDLGSWPRGESDVYLNGFTYDLIGGSSPETFAERRDWLARGSRFEGDFYPQPYTQLARVLRAAGHEGEARKVLHERQKILNAEARKAVFARPQPRLWLWPFLPLLWFWRWITDLLLRAIVGYGFAPVRALVTTALVVGLAALGFSLAYALGAIVPASDVILTSLAWWLAVLQSPDAPTLIWQDHHPAPHYETFYALAYAFDVFVPLVDLGQQSAWSATTVTTLGLWARFGTMALEVAGWLVTALGAAAVTGIIQRDKD